jgi:hypothetical protein
VNGVTAGAPLPIQGPLAGFVPTVTGDFNGDGRADLVWQHSDGRMRMALMNGGAVLGSRDFPQGRSGWFVSFAPDLDGNGKSDLVWANPDGTYGAWLMNGVNPVTTGGLLSVGNTGWAVIGFGDLDGDGKADLLWHKDTGESAVWFMNGLTPSAYRTLLGPATGWELTP